MSGLVEFPRALRIPAALLLLAALAPVTAGAAPTAFRIGSLSLRDPHVFATVIVCRDLTDTPLAGYSINNQIQTDIASDANSDGQLDLNELIVFDPLDQGGSSGALLLVAGECTAPVSGTQCQPGSGSVATFTYQNHATGTCLAPIAGTTFGYTPAIVSSIGNCFATDQGTIPLVLAGIPMTLHFASIGGVYSGAPATSIVNGLITGFISEADANATILPASQPIIGGLALSHLFPGGTGNCSGHSDKDLKDGAPGWWVYLNYTASVVPYSDGTTAVEESGPPGVHLSAARPNPSRGSVAVDYSMPVAGGLQVWVSDLAGRRVATLARGIEAPGVHTVAWDGRDADGLQAPAGVYFIHVEALGRTSTRRVALVR